MGASLSGTRQGLRLESALCAVLWPMPTPHRDSDPPSHFAWPAFVLPALCALAATIVWLGGLNQPLFLFLQPLTRHLPDVVWAFITDQAGLLSLAAWATLLLLVRPAISAAILFACPAGLIFVRGLKFVVSADRPQQLLSADMIHIIGRELSSLSFPSGHTAAAFTAASAALHMLPQPLRRRWWLPAVALASLVGISRIAVGAHWPVDVLGGAAIGWLIGLTGALAAHHWPVWRRPHGLLMLAIIGLGAGIARVTLDSGYPSVELFGRLLGIAAIAVAALVLTRQMSVFR